MELLSSQIPSKVQPSVKARSVVKIACVARPSTHNQSSKPRSPHILQLNSTLLPLIPVIAAARVNPIESLLKPQAEYFATLGLPEWLIHWGHPGNMAVVLFAMGFYGRLVTLITSPSTLHFILCPHFTSDPPLLLLSYSQRLLGLAD